MKRSDAVFVAKKILVGLAIGAAPRFSIGGMGITQTTYHNNAKPTAKPRVEVRRAY